MSQSRTTLPPCQSYAARDGSKLDFRWYPAQSDHVMILLHGISEDSKYLHPLAEFVASNDLAHVCTPDLRGYGEKPARRGDVDYIGQIEDDLGDLMKVIKAKHPGARIILAGHSAGGGTVIRLAGSRYSSDVQAYLLFAPLLGPGAPTDKPSNGAFCIHTKRLITLFILNGLGIRRWNHLPVMVVNRPEDARHGGEVTELSFRLLVSRTPLKYKKDLPKLTKPTLVLAGSNDEAFRADQYEPVFAAYTRAKVQIIPNETHDGLLESRETHEKVKAWLTGLKADPKLKPKETAPSL
jgi:non-heme chloroperoxidase